MMAGSTWGSEANPLLVFFPNFPLGVIWSHMFSKEAETSIMQKYGHGKYSLYLWHNVDSNLNK